MKQSTEQVIHGLPVGLVMADVDACRRYLLNPRSCFCGQDNCSGHGVRAAGLGRLLGASWREANRQAGLGELEVPEHMVLAERILLA